MQKVYLDEAAPRQRGLGLRPRTPTGALPLDPAGDKSPDPAGTSFRSFLQRTVQGRSVNSKLLGNLARGERRVSKHRRGHLHLFGAQRTWPAKWLATCSSCSQPCTGPLSNHVALGLC